MGSVTLLEETTKNPVTLIGKCAGICWGANTEDNQKNYDRGVSCLASGHFRTAEYPQVYLVLDGYSARVIRELYTHIAGGPTRLQASTRYIEYGKFDYIIPNSIEKEKEANQVYNNMMEATSAGYKHLEALGVPKEDIANILPLGMETKIVIRTNLRHLIDMSHLRLCNRAYWEFRELMKDIMKELSNYSEEWDYVVKTFFKPKCQVYGFCDEKNTCGASYTKERLEQLVSFGLEYELNLKNEECI